MHLAAAAQTQDEVQGRLLLDVVVGEGAAVLQLLARKDEALLIGGDALLVLDLLLDVFDRVRAFDVQGDGFARQSLDEDLHAGPAAQTQDEVQGRLLLDVVVGQRPAIFELLAGEDQALLIRRDAFLVLNLGLHVLNRVR